METRANHLLIGAFVLAMAAGLFGFVVWLAKVDVDRELDRYYVYLEGSVTGLSTAGEVRYNGIPVGSVTEIIIDPDDPRRVRVTIEVAGTTPVREDTIASLELQGITGVSYINLTGGDPESPKLRRKEGEALAVIASRPSRFEAIFASAPDALEAFVVLVNRAALFFDEDNRQATAAILADLSTLSGTLASRSQDLGRILDDIEGTSGEMQEAAVTVSRVAAEVEALIRNIDATLAVARGTLAGADELMENDLRGLVTDSRTALRSVAGTSDELEAMIAENREAFRAFSSEGLFEFSRLVIEARFLVGSLSRLAERLETDPAQFLFGGAGEPVESE